MLTLADMSFLLAIVLANAPVGEPPARERRTAVFLQPLGSVLYGLLGGVSASAGAQFMHGERWSLVVDAAFVWGPGLRPGASERFPGGLSVAASLGASCRVWGQGLNGFFITPKIYAVTNASHQLPGGVPPTVVNDPTRRIRWNSGEVGAAVELGFQWTFGAFFLGSVLGVGGGWYVGPATNGYVGGLSSFGGALAADDPSRMSGPVIAFNVHLLRVGAAF